MYPADTAAWNWANDDALGQCRPMLVGQSRYRETNQDCAVKFKRAVELDHVASVLPTLYANGKYSSNLHKPNENNQHRSALLDRREKPKSGRTRH